MKRSLATLALVFLSIPMTALAQESNEEWLDDCRDHWGHYGSRARHCEIRELGMKPSKGPLRVEPGMNGGVEIIGWNRDSIAITARIQVNARTQNDAEAIARDIKIETAGGVVRVAGARSSSGRNQHWGVMFI